MSQARWQALWLVQAQRRGWLAAILRPVALVYGALWAITRFLYRVGLKKSHKVNVPVVVVGNVVVGGAGKTPTVIAVVHHLQARGWRPGVVSRGHGRHSEHIVDVQPDTDLRHSGDEPALIRLRTGVPVLVSSRRVEAARSLLLAHPGVDIIVCDDGLQHLALQRDVEIVVFDDRGAGNGWLLPAGLLREPWPRVSKDTAPAGMVLHQCRESAPQTALACAPGTQLFSAVRRLSELALGPAGERMPLHDLRDSNPTAVAGIARPGVFFDMLRACGVEPTHEVALPDHAALKDYASVLKDSTATLVCTEKDAIKLFPEIRQSPAGHHPRIWAVPLELTPDPAFFTELDKRLGALKPGD